jgi:hypothetical protein
MEQILSWDANCHSACQKFPAFHDTPRFITPDPYSEPDASSQHLPSYFPKIHFNIIFPSIPRFSTWSPPFKFSN